MGYTWSPVMHKILLSLAGRDYHVIVWGEEALRRLGLAVPSGLDHDVMLVVEQGDMVDAGYRLLSGGFQRTPISYALDLENRRHIHDVTKRRIERDFKDFNMITQRFVYRRPLAERIHGMEETIKVCLIPSWYAQISVMSDSALEFDYIGEFFWPKASRLLISFVTVAVTGPITGLWKHLLVMWATFWLYRGGGLPDTVMDHCDHELAREYFIHYLRRVQFGRSPLATLFPHLADLIVTVAFPLPLPEIPGLENAEQVL
ncbi:unnamed protein product, partial [Clonostachys rosea]